MALRYFVIPFAVVLLLAALMLMAANRGVFTDRTANYSLRYSSDWKKISSPDQGDFTLVCVNPICRKSVVFVLHASFKPELAEAPQEEFFKTITPPKVVQMSSQALSDAGSAEPLTLPMRTTVGNSEGYKGQLKLTLNSGGDRYITYGIVFDHGHYYHLKVVTPPQIADQIRPLTNELFSGFKVGA